MSGCRLDVTSAQNCAAVREQALRALRPVGPTLVGKFGNSSQTATTDWVTILNREQDLSSSVDLSQDSPSRCHDVLVRMTLEILWARWGIAASAAPAGVLAPTDHVSLPPGPLQVDSHPLHPPSAAWLLVGILAGSGLSPGLKVWSSARDMSLRWSP